MANEKVNVSGGEALGAAAGLVSADKLGQIAGKPGDSKVAPKAAPAAVDPVIEPGKVKVDPKVGGPAPAAAVQPKADIEPIVVDTPLGKKIYGAKLEGDKDVTLSSFDDVKSFAGAFNIDLKEVNDLQGFIKEYDKLKVELGSAATTKAQFENQVRSLNGLPTEVSMILDAALKSQDYTSLIQNIAQRGVLNFNKNFSDYPEHDLVNHYSDQKYTKDEFNEMDEQQYKALRMMANTRYDTDKLTHQNSIKDQQRSADLTQQNFDQSVEASITQLKTNNPDIGEVNTQRVRNIMTAELHGTLFNPDNTYKPDAAERIAMQEFGRETILAQEHTISDLVAKYTAKGRSDANEQLLQNSDKRLVPGGGAAPDDNKLSTEVQKATGFMHARG